MSPALDAAEVRALLPHRHPIRLVDRVDELVPGTRLVAVKAVTCNEPWYAAADRGAGPVDFGYPEALVQESWTQAAGVLCATSRAPGAGEVMLAGAVSGLRFHRRVLPGDVLRHEVVVARELPDTVLVHGSSTVDGELVCTVDRMVLAFRPATTLRAVTRTGGGT